MRGDNFRFRLLWSLQLSVRTQQGQTRENGDNDQDLLPETLRRQGRARRRRVLGNDPVEGHEVLETCAGVVLMNTVVIDPTPLVVECFPCAKPENQAGQEVTHKQNLKNTAHNGGVEDQLEKATRCQEVFDGDQRLLHFSDPQQDQQADERPLSFEANEHENVHINKHQVQGKPGRARLVI